MEEQVRAAFTALLNSRAWRTAANASTFEWVFRGVVALLGSGILTAIYDTLFGAELWLQVVIFVSLSLLLLMTFVWLIGYVRSRRLLAGAETRPPETRIERSIRSPVPLPSTAIRQWAQDGTEVTPPPPVQSASSSDSPTPPVEEARTVAIHWLGSVGGEYVADIPQDPTVTTWVTPSRWRKDLMNMRDAEGFSMFGLGEASPREDEAHRRLDRVARHIRIWLDKAKVAAEELRNLKADALDDMNRAYWKNRVMDAERELENQVTVRMPGARERLPRPMDPDSLNIDDRWSSVYLQYLASRIAEYEQFATPSLADVGFPPRRADPTSAFTYTSSRWNKTVEFQADDEGIVQPLNEEENKKLDGYQVPYA